MKKQLKLNDVYTTIKLNKSQLSKAKSLKNSILLYGNVLQDLSNRALELKKEEKEIIRTLQQEKLCAKKDRSQPNGNIFSSKTATRLIDDSDSPLSLLNSCSDSSLSSDEEDDELDSIT